MPPVGKLLLLVIVFFVVYVVVKAYLRRDQTPSEPGAQPAPPMTGNNEDMVRCAQCGVHLPRSESMLSKGNYFCSNEHRLQYKG